MTCSRWPAGPGSRRWYGSCRGICPGSTSAPAWIVTRSPNCWPARSASAAVSLPASRLRVAWLDRRAGAFGNKVLGTYLTAAMTQLLRQALVAQAGGRWQHTLCVLGAEKLAGEVLDGLCDACEISGTG